ncbi:hypothetical protein FQN54_009498 [Arachnomyces sp. PD_36]|nr:hypothetical protein FQN54_009498 [Arachnomyces sp. PD_36]
MGQSASTPQPGTQIQVIGAGMPRTGTTSFSAALGILLDGPVYHGGTQTTRGPSIELKSWIRILHKWLEGDRRTVLPMIKSRLSGYAAITDAPGCQLLPELLELYPDAKVICTLRDTAAWENSMSQISVFTGVWFLKVLLLPVPGMRHFADYIWLLRRQWGSLYLDGFAFDSAKMASGTLTQGAIYTRHIAWLKENVPADRLVFFDVKEGWEPLCQALGKEVPQDIPFPHVNDSEGIKRTAKYFIRQALIRWAGIAVVVAGIAVVGFRKQ